MSKIMFSESIILLNGMKIETKLFEDGTFSLIGLEQKFPPESIKDLMESVNDILQRANNRFQLELKKTS